MGPKEKGTWNHGRKWGESNNNNNNNNLYGGSSHHNAWFSGSSFEDKINIKIH